MKLLFASASVIFLAAASCFGAQALALDTEKQPVLLLCPKHERYGSWSLFVIVDKSDPSKVLALGLEELVNHNSLDDGGYEKVIQAQLNPNTERAEIGRLDAASFGSGSLKVKKDKALNVTCTPIADGYQLMIDMRTTADGHFIIGGAEANHRSLVLKYSPDTKTWHTYATVLQTKDGKNAVGAEPLLVTGFHFPVTGSGIHKILAALGGGKAVVVFDKEIP